MGEDGAAGTPKYAVLYSLALAYLVALFCVAVVARRWKDSASKEGGELQAHYGGQFNTPLLILTTFSTVYSGFTVTGIPEEASRRGFVSLRWVGATIAIVGSMMLLYPRLRRLAIERGYTGPNDFIADRFGTQRVRLLTGICSFVPMQIYIGAQMISFAAMLSGVTNDTIPRWACILLLIVILLVFEKLGGMNSVVLTDAVQSGIMILSFLLVPFVLGAAFGYLPEIAPASCSTLEYVQAAGESASKAPAVCSGWQQNISAATGCVPSGCVAAVKPNFYKNPTVADQADIFFFLFNMIGAPLQPHMIQRAYIAASDRALKITMVAMMFAPFLAQTPGIIMGITKAAYAPAWAEEVRSQTAFSAVASALADIGGIEYLLVSIMTCATMAAIMSTADSAIMGAASLTIDLYRSLVSSTAPERLILHIGEVTSVLMCACGFGLAMVLSVTQLGHIILIQTGMLMQLLPVYSLGLFTNVRERAVLYGMCAGLLVLVALLMTGNPFDPYIPLVNVSVFMNFVTVFAVHFVAPGPDPRLLSEGQPEDAAGDAVEAAPEKLTRPVLHRDIIESYVAASGEPRKPLVALALLLVLASTPWYGRPGVESTIVLGLPLWGFAQLVFLVAALAAGLVALATWRQEIVGSGREANTSHTSRIGKVVQAEQELEALSPYVTAVGRGTGHLPESQT